jgi:tetratricopeptide (TPR) repeat protein
MKKITLFLFVGLISSFVNAQIQVPQPSPSAKIEQEVGLTNVTVEYSRPGMRGRTIFGDLVPYGEKWRTGANNNTKISFDTNVVIDGKELKAGNYAIYSIPKENEWEVLFYEDSNNWVLPQDWQDSKVALRATAPVQEMPMTMQTFTILIDELQNDSAVLNFIWENTIATLPFEVPTDERAMASIERVMNGPSAGDYFAAATYFHDEKKDLGKAYEWIKKAVEIGGEDAYWVVRRKALIEADLGKKKEAIATAKKSLAAAEKAGNQDYVKLNQDSLKEWGAM